MREETIVSFNRDDELDESREDQATGRDPSLDEDLERDLPPNPSSTVRKPIPRRVKIGLGVVGAMTFGASAWVLLSLEGVFGGSAKPEPWQLANMSLQDTIAADLTGVEQSLTAAYQAADQAASEELSAALQSVTAELSATNTGLLDRVSSLEEQLTFLTAQVSDQDNTISSIRTAVNNRSADVAFVRDEVRRAVQQYERKWSELSEDVAAQGGVSPSLKAIDNSALPFQVISMDLWDGKPQLAVRDGERWRFLRVGDRLRDWTVMTADYGAGVITLRSPRGQPFVLGLSPNRSDAVARFPEPRARVPGELPTLTVLAEPTNATVKVMNIVPKYHDGMALRPGGYDILVSHPGFESYRRWIRLGDQDRVLHVALSRQ